MANLAWTATPPPNSVKICDGHMLLGCADAATASVFARVNDFAAPEIARHFKSALAGNIPLARQLAALGPNLQYVFTTATPVGNNHAVPFELFYIQ